MPRRAAAVKPPEDKPDPLVAAAQEMDTRIASANGKKKSTPRSRQAQVEQHYLSTTSKDVKHRQALWAVQTLQGGKDALTAAAMVLDPTAAPTGGYPTPNAVTRTWQHAAWGYTRSVPELNAAMMFIGNCLSRCKLVAGMRDPDGSIEQGFDGDEPKDDADPKVKSALLEAAQYINKLQTPRGGQSEILRSFGEKSFVAGECYLVPEDKPTGLIFEVLSTQELMPEGDRYVRFYGPGWGTDPLPEGTKPIRVWAPDGQYQMLSTSSVRACLEVLEELVVLTRLVRAAAISRMSLAGMLVIPDELDTPDDEDDADGNQAEAKNPLAVDIINTGAKAIDDPASAAAWMPYLLQGPAEFLDKVRHVPFQTDDQENVIKRAEAVDRLARGLDLPPEKVLGHMGTTYANAGQVSEDNFNLYIEPKLQMLCDALTVAYLWPAMAAARRIDAEHLKDAPYPDEITAVAITYDARKLISRPDRTAEIIDVFNKDLTFTTIKTAEMREALGLDPDDPPDDDEVARRIDAYRLGRIREVIPAPPSDAAVPIADATDGKAVVPGQSGGAAIAGQAGKVAEEARRQAADSDTAHLSDPAALLASAALGDPLRLLAVKIAACAELTVERALEKVGARIQSRARGSALSEVEKAAIDGVENVRVARVLGERVVTRVLGSDTDPMLAEVDAFARKVAGWAREAECADDKVVANEAKTIVLTLARRALYEDPPDVTADTFGQVVLGVSVGVGA